jgi:DNA-binding transcriptional LysR family regulator
MQIWPGFLKWFVPISVIANVNLASVDLNLLVAFEALLAERNVSRAAERIGRAQPSMSNALTRLRALFGDELFVRTPQEMRPTPRALELAAPVAEALEQVRRALEPHGAFDPAISRRYFYIVSNEYADFMLLMKVLPVLRKAAPQTSLDVRAADEAHAVELLDQGVADLAVGCFRHAPKRLRWQPLYEERCVCIARRDHPDLVGGLTLENFVRLPHLVVSAARNPTHMVDEALRSDGLRRRIVQTIHSFALVPHLLEVSDLVAVVGDRVGRRIASAGHSIAIHELPFPMVPWKVDLLWSRRSDADPALVWLRRCFLDAGAGL